MHHSCISEWFQTSLKCPICKEDVTLESIKNKIESINNQDDFLHVNNMQSPDTSSMVQFNYGSVLPPIKRRTFEENKDALSSRTIDRRHLFATIL